MPVYDAQGKVIEGGMTPDEVKAQVAAAEAKAKADAETVTKALNDQLAQEKKNAEDIKAKLDAAVAAGGDNAALRTLLEETNKKVTDLQGKVEAAPKAAEQMILGRTKDELISKLSGGKKELADKMTLNYERLLKAEPADKQLTQERVSELIADAYKMSEDKPNYNALNQVIPSKANGGAANQNTDQNGVNEVFKPWLGSFGLTEEQFTKYIGKAVEKDRKHYPK